MRRKIPSLCQKTIIHEDCNCKTNFNYYNAQQVQSSFHEKNGTTASTLASMPCSDSASYETNNCVAINWRMSHFINYCRLSHCLVFKLTCNHYVIIRTAKALFIKWNQIELLFGLQLRGWTFLLNNPVPKPIECQ